MGIAMKIKKFNAAVAAIVFVAAAVGYCLMPSSGPTLTGSGPVTEVKVLAGDLKYSMADRKIVEIPWQSSQNTMPGKARLVKWDEGDKVFYQISGPVNKKTLKATDFYDGSSQWGESTEMEVYFERTGNKYDQWLINTENSQILHYKDYWQFEDSSRLPASRYTCELKGDEIVTTFWTYKDDSPANIVFNYNNNDGKTGNEVLSWVTTGQKTIPANHHDKSKWTNP